MTNGPRLLAAAIALAGATSAAAVPLDAVPGDLRIDIAPVEPALTYLEDGAGGADLLLDPLTFGFDEAGEDYYLDLFVTYALDDPAGSLAGVLSISGEEDGSERLFDGLLERSGNLPGDIVQFLFQDDEPSVPGLAPRLLVELAFAEDLPGDDPLRALSDGTRYAVVGSVQSVAPIPVPASLPLLLGAGAALALLGRRRA